MWGNKWEKHPLRFPLSLTPDTHTTMVSNRSMKMLFLKSHNFKQYKNQSTCNLSFNIKNNTKKEQLTCNLSFNIKNNTKKTINLQPEFQYQEQYKKKQLTCNLSFNIKNAIKQSFYTSIVPVYHYHNKCPLWCLKQLGNTWLHYPHSWSFAEIPWKSHHSWEWNHELVESWVIGTHEINKPMKTWPLTHVTANVGT